MSDAKISYTVYARPSISSLKDVSYYTIQLPKRIDLFGDMFSYTNAIYLSASNPSYLQNVEYFDFFSNRTTLSALYPPFSAQEIDDYLIVDNNIISSILIPQINDIPSDSTNTFSIIVKNNAGYSVSEEIYLTPTSKIILAGIQNLNSIYSPLVVNYEYMSVLTDLLSNSSDFYSPFLNYNLNNSLLTNTGILYSPEIYYSLTNNLITNSSSLYEPEIYYNLTNTLITNSSSLYDFVLNYNLETNLLTNTNTLLALSATVSLALSTISFDLFTNSNSLYLPELNYNLTNILITASNTLYGPDLLLTITNEFINNSNTLYSFTFEYPLLLSTNDPLQLSDNSILGLFTDFLSINLSTFNNTSSLYTMYPILSGGINYSTSYIQQLWANAESAAPNSTMTLSADTFRIAPDYNSDVLAATGDGLISVIGSGQDLTYLIQYSRSETLSGEPVDPTLDTISWGRGGFFNAVSYGDFYWEGFKLTGQTQPTSAAGDPGNVETGWDTSHKGYIIPDASGGEHRFKDVWFDGFRGEEVWAGGITSRYVEAIDCKFSNCNASMWSVSGDQLLKNCIFIDGYNGTECLIWNGQTKVVENCTFDLAQTFDHAKYGIVYIGQNTATLSASDNWFNTGNQGVAFSDMAHNVNLQRSIFKNCAAIITTASGGYTSEKVGNEGYNDIIIEDFIVEAVDRSFRAITLQPSDEHNNWIIDKGSIINNGSNKVQYFIDTSLPVSNMEIRRTVIPLTTRPWENETATTLRARWFDSPVLDPEPYQSFAVSAVVTKLPITEGILPINTLNAATSAVTFGHVNALSVFPDGWTVTVQNNSGKTITLKPRNDELGYSIADNDELELTYSSSLSTFSQPISSLQTIESTTGNLALSGSWTTKSGTDGVHAYGTTYLITNTAVDDPLKRARLHLTVPQTGYYRIELFKWVDENALYGDIGTIRINHAGGSFEWTSEFRFAKNGWNDVGLFHLKPTGCSIDIETTTNASIATRGYRITFEKLHNIDTSLSRVSLSARGDGLDTIRSQIFEEMLPEYNVDLYWNRHAAHQWNRRLQYYWDSLITDTVTMSTLPGVYYEYRSNQTTYAPAFSLHRLALLSYAYHYQPVDHHGLNNLYQNSQLLDDIVRAVGWIAENRFNGWYNWKNVEYTPGSFSDEWSANWYQLEITAPEFIGHTLLTISQHLSADTISAFGDFLNIYRNNNDQYLQYTTSSDAVDLNLVAIQLPWILRGINENDTTKLSDAKTTLDGVFAIQTNYAPNENGIYSDGGCMKDEAAEMHGYFNSMIEKWGRVKMWLNGTAWEPSSASLTIISDLIENGFEPYFTNQDSILPVAMGRGISFEIGQNLINNITHNLAGSLKGGDFTLAKSLIKRNMSRISGDITDSFVEDNVDLHESMFEIGKIASDPDIKSIQLPDRFRSVNSVCQMVVRRPDWSLVIKGESNRVRGGKFTTYANKKPWYQGSGTLYLENGDKRWKRDMPPTMDSYRWTGTTVAVSATRTESQDCPLTSNTFSGGTSLNDEAATYGIDYIANRTTYSSTIVAKKSVFAVGDYVIFLGAGISSTDGYPITTIIEQINIDDGGNQLTIDGIDQTTSIPMSGYATPNNIWIECENTVGEGILFLDSSNVIYKRAERTGNWAEIKNNESNTDKTYQYITLEVDHGTDPLSGSYAYCICPHITQGAFNALSASPPITVLENSTDLQAITVGNYTLATVWTATSAVPITAGDFTIDQPCGFIGKVGDDGTIYVSAADPSLSATNVNITHPDLISPITLNLNNDFLPVEYQI